MPGKILSRTASAALLTLTALIAPPAHADDVTPVEVTVNARAALATAPETGIGTNHAIWDSNLGTDQTADVSDTVAGFPHQVYRDSSGRAVVETYSLTGMGHGQPVDPGTGAEQCGTAGAYVLDVNLCAAYRMGLAWGLSAG